MPTDDAVETSICFPYAIATAIRFMEIPKNHEKHAIIADEFKHLPYIIQSRLE